MQKQLAFCCLVMTLSPGLGFGQTIFAEGLQLPQRIIATPSGNFLVSEGGTATPHTGRISIVDRQGNRRSLIEGLPAGRGHGIPAFGPTGLALAGRTLYILVGEGDLLVGPPFAVNPDGVSSPIFSSVLKIEFSTAPDQISSAFQLAFNDQWALHDGYDVQLQNANAERAHIQLLKSFRALYRNILGGTERVRRADPYGAWLDAANDTLYVIDPGAETLTRVNTVTGRSNVIARFQPYERAMAGGTQYVDHVPTAICAAGDTFLVSFLSAAPFPQGEASVGVWRPSDGGWSKPAPLIRDLNLVNDLACIRGSTGTPRVVTVELSTDSTIRATPATGRVQIFDGTQRRILAEELPLPTGITVDPITGGLFVVTLTGVLYRLPPP